MSLTVRDCLNLPSLSFGTVMAGEGGLSNIVNTVSVVEFYNYNNNGDNLYTPNELLITAFYALKDNPDAQCRAIEEYKRSGDVGMILFYFGIVTKEIDPRVLETADRLDFPLISLPGEYLRYSDVIGDVMEAIFIDRKSGDFFINNTMERIAQLSESKRNITTVLSFAGEYAKASFFLCDENHNLIASSNWPIASKSDFTAVLDSFSTNKVQNHVYKIAFSVNKGTKLTLYAEGKNNKLNVGIMNQVAEVIQLFASIWNYNLNISTKESLIPALFEDDHCLMEKILSEQKLNIEIFSSILFVTPTFTDTPEKNARTASMEMVLKLRRLLVEENSKSIVDLFGGTIAIICDFSRASVSGTILFDRICDLLDQKESCCLYGIFENLRLNGGAKELYLMYCESIAATKTIYPMKHCFSGSEIAFGNTCIKLFHSMDKAYKKHLKLLRPLLEAQAEEDLLPTLCTYLLDCDSEVKQTAALLFVHRNTVQYRLSKIKTLLAMDFSKMPMTYEVYLAVALYRIVSAS